MFSPLADRDNPAAARRISDLAARNAATLTVFGAIPEPSRLQRALHRSDYLDAIREAEGKAIAAKLARCVPKDADIAVETKTAIGSPALSIIEQVLRANHDLVVVTTDEDDEDQATINRLLRKCPCPVWVIRPTRARIQRVLAAVNPDPSEAELSRTILELAASMTKLYGGELHLVHAWELYGESMMRNSAYINTPASELERLLREEEAGERAALDELISASDLDDEPWQIHLHKGRAADVIGETVDKRRINLLVMGTVARTGVSGLLIGNTAESVLDDVRCSVIAVKPPGFVTPIQPPPR
ncbi:MAG: universal stress protein [Acidimicrobiales bacterium]